METDPNSPLAPIQTVAATVAMTLALLLIGFGIWALGGAIYAAWTLFRDPASIDYFAKYFLETTELTQVVQVGGKGLAHYVAWVAVVLLLLLLGKLGAWAVGAGAQLFNLRAPRRD